MAGALGLISTIGTDERIDGSVDFDYPITVDKILALDQFREGLISKVLGTGAAAMASARLIGVAVTGVRGLPLVHSTITQDEA